MWLRRAALGVDEHSHPLTSQDDTSSCALGLHVCQAPLGLCQLYKRSVLVHRFGMGLLTRSTHHPERSLPRDTVPK